MSKLVNVYRYVLIAGLLTAIPALAETALSGLASHISQFTLDNGMRVAVFSRLQSPLVHIELRVRAGAIDEPDNLPGLSRVVSRSILGASLKLGSRDIVKERAALEKVEKSMDAVETLSKGDPYSLKTQEAQTALRLAVLAARQMHAPAPYAVELQKHGIAMTTMNSGADWAIYHWRLTPDKTVLLLGLIADWLAEPSWRDFYALRDQLLTEKGDNQEQDQSELTSRAFSGHPYSKIAAAPNKDGMRTAAAKAFFRQAFRPDRAAISLAGAVNPAEVRQWAASTLAKVPKPDSAGVGTDSAALKMEKEIVLEMPGANTVPLIVAYARPASSSPDSMAYEVLAEYLAGTGQSKLSRALAFDGGPSSGVQYQSHVPGTRLDHYFVISVTRRLGVSLGQVLKSFDTAVEAIRSSPPDQADLRAAVSRTRMKLMTAFQTNQNASSTLAFFANLGLTADGEWRRLDAITPESLHALARQALDPNRRIRFAPATGAEP